MTLGVTPPIIYESQAKGDVIIIFVNYKEWESDIISIAHINDYLASNYAHCLGFLGQI
jgi:hypothetical protein